MPLNNRGRYVPDHFHGEKYCRGCKTTKPRSEFQYIATRGWLASRCKECSRQELKRRRENRPTDPESVKKHRAKIMAYLRRKQFGITPEEYEALQTSQNNLCAICGRPEKQVRKGLVCALNVDHDHQTGKIRELLCNACNAGIGWFGEDPARLDSAAAYLRRHGKI